MQISEPMETSLDHRTKKFRDGSKDVPWDPTAANLRISEFLSSRKARWAGSNPSRWAKISTEWYPRIEGRKRGKPRERWSDNVTGNWSKFVDM
ncbi:unnamed protein product [Caenorhabditis sp. 36 PRJEB53466]|nr:unnamed protein product [Caenorhabditis sp. 36 PRJEB53466]